MTSGPDTRTTTGQGQWSANSETNRQELSHYQFIEANSNNSINLHNACKLGRVADVMDLLEKNPERVNELGKSSLNIFISILSIQGSPWNSYGTIDILVWLHLICV